MIELGFAKIIGGNTMGKSREAFRRQCTGGFEQGRLWLCSPAMGRVGQLLLGARPTGDNAKTVTLSTGGRRDSELRAGVLRFLDLLVKDGNRDILGHDNYRTSVCSVYLD